MRLPSLLFSALCLLSACSKDDAAATDLAAQEILDLSYGTNARHRMDVYLPATRNADTKVMIFVHGGGFILGSKNEVTDMAKQFYNAGYAVVNINYRLIDTAGLFATPIRHQPSSVKIADQLADLQQAVTFAQGKAGEWGLSNNRWGMSGHSAGATLALLYVHGSRNQGRQIKVGGNFAGALNFGFNDESELNSIDPRIKEVLYRATGAEPVNANKLAYMAISPYWVSNNSGNAVPVANVRPANDELSPDGGAQQFSSYTQLLNSKSVPNRYTTISNAGHSFSGSGQWAQAVEAATGFFAEHLK